jgi:protoporphyrinogen oxidase
MPHHEQSQKEKKALIIGAGPAGLTAAYELLEHTDIKPIIVETNPTYVGGISKTVNYKGYRIDIGGHRFFSKSDAVMNWWLKILPLESETAHISYQGKNHTVSGTSKVDQHDDIMLVRKRISRVYYNGHFFDYPIKLSIDTVTKLGFIKMVKIGCTYLYRLAFPKKPEKNLEDFFINRFGDELYRTFFKSYTEKVWGKPCNELSAEWGAQRIKGLSILKALSDAFFKPFKKNGIEQKNVETSLIEQFLYPKFGPGHLWEKVAEKIKERGGEIIMGARMTGLSMDYEKIATAVIETQSGEQKKISADYFFSTTSIKELVAAFDWNVPSDVREVSSALEFRDFITVGVLIDKRFVNDCENLNDTWIYIHEPNVRVGRIQVFNNWSPYLVQDDSFLWLGLEYFCTEGDTLWDMNDEDLKSLAIKELQSLGIINTDTIADATVLREKKTYPVYAGAYASFNTVQKYLDSIQNLFPIGRNGMHRYNNQDHSMLTAMEAVKLIVTNNTDTSSLWEINTEQDYHEEKTSQ